MQIKDGYYFPDTDTHFNKYTFGYGLLYDMLDRVPNRRVAIDGGAHVGGWTREMAKEFDLVLAFEPSKENFECLVENTKGLENVELYNFALGDCEKSGSLHPPVNDGNSGAAWVVDGDDFEVRTIDGLNLECVDFIKLDIEGYEPFAITGATDTIDRCSPVFLIEQKGITARYGFPYDEAGERLKDMGYTEVIRAWNDYVFTR